MNERTITLTPRLSAALAAFSAVEFHDQNGPSCTHRDDEAGMTSYTHVAVTLINELLDALNDGGYDNAGQLRYEIAHRYLWGDDTADLSETAHPYAIFVERIVTAWDDSDDCIDSAQRLVGAIDMMVQRLES